MKFARGKSRKDKNGQYVKKLLNGKRTRVRHTHRNERSCSGCVEWKSCKAAGWKGRHARDESIIESNRRRFYQTILNVKSDKLPAACLEAIPDSFRETTEFEGDRE